MEAKCIADISHILHRRVFREVTSCMPLQEEPVQLNVDFNIQQNISTISATKREQTQLLFVE